MYERILIVVDEPATSAHALDEGLALASAHGSEVVLLGVLPAIGPPVGDLPAMGLAGYADLEPHAQQEARRRLQAAAATARAAGVRVRPLVVDHPDPVHGIAQITADLRCDLVVVGADGHNAVMRLLTGSVIPGLITHAKVPVLVCQESRRRVRRPDGTAPVELDPLQGLHGAQP